MCGCWARLHRVNWSADPNELAGRNVRGRRHREALIAADLAVALEDFGDALRLGFVAGHTKKPKVSRKWRYCCRSFVVAYRRAL